MFQVNSFLGALWELSAHATERREKLLTQPYTDPVRAKLTQTPKVTKYMLSSMLGCGNRLFRE